MAEQEGSANASGQVTNGGGEFPQVAVVSQYVKDLSFENPNAPAVYQWQSQPNIDVQFNIAAAQVGEGMHEVALQITVKAKGSDQDGQEQTAFMIDLLYAGLFAIRNIPQEQMEPFLLAEAPRILFPFARRVISDSVLDGGFPPLMLDPIDFASLYMQQAAQREAQASGGQAGEVTGQA
jgi:preprotein translocase subunit SecB